VLLHRFNAGPQLAVRKFTDAGAEHLLVFGQGSQRTTRALFDGSLNLAHLCLTPEELSDWIWTAMHINQRKTEKAKAQVVMQFVSSDMLYDLLRNSAVP
jgi:hypothetical protein